MKKKEKNEIVQLFEEFESGNKEVLEEIYNKYQKTIYGIAFSILKNKDDSEDILQSVFIKIHTLDNSKLPKDNVTSWLYTLTKNEALQLLRKQKNNIELDSIYDLEDTDSEINKLIDKETYNNLISKLNSKEKEIISLKILSNLSFEEISQLLGEKTGTIKWRYYKAIYNLRLLLSNLLMSIVVFSIGIVRLKKTKSSTQSNKGQDVVDNQISESQDVNENYNNEQTKSELQDTQKYNNQLNSIQNDIGTENIIINEHVAQIHSNYIGIGFLSISFVFFIVTIFSIILKKHQLNLRKKSSK